MCSVTQPFRMWRMPVQLRQLARCFAIDAGRRWGSEKRRRRADPASFVFYRADATSLVSLPVPMIGIVIDAGCAASCKMVTWE